MLRPPENWIEQLPKNRLIVEMSMWSANLSRLEDDLKRVEAQTDIFHLDVADGHFSPAFLFFPDLVAKLRGITAKPFHVHLMIKDEILLDQIAQFAEAGADLISLHAENSNAAEGLSAIRNAGIKAGIVLQLHSPVAVAEQFLSHIQMLTLLGTRIGVKGQSLDAEAGARLKQARALVQNTKHRIVVAADGGIRENTVAHLRKSGAETIVMGSLAFGASDFGQRIEWVHQQ